MPKREDLICVGCQKTPDQIAEYVEAAANEPEYYEDAHDYVIKEEGTLNPENGHFLCTDCYIDAGQPSHPHPRRWVAP